MTDAPPVDPSFEEALEKLQVTVKRLESGELSLEDALQKFEEGIRLSRFCQEKLSVAEQRVELLVKASQNGQSETKSYDPRA